MKRLLTAGLVTLLSTCVIADTAEQQEEGSQANPAGVYTLVEVNGNKVPTTVSHGAEMSILSGTFTITADKTCTSKIVLRVPPGEEITKEVKATFTQEGSTLTMEWEGAGINQGTIEGNIFTMDNGGMVFTYKRNP
jgi:hypothetical protein